MSNAARQNEEIEALQSMYSGAGEFELLGDLPQEGSTASTCFRLQAAGGACTVLVTFPPEYPADACPTFAVEGLKASKAASLGRSLASLARTRQGEECVFDVLQSLDGLLAAEEEAVPFEAEAAATAQASAGGFGGVTGAVGKSKWGWATAAGSGTILQVGLRSGAKVKTTKITNLSELRRMPEVGAVEVDLQPSRNTENYELARLIAGCTKVQESEVELLAGGKKEKATGERQVRIAGLAPEEVVARILASA